MTSDPTTPNSPTDIAYLLDEVDRWHEAALIGLSRESRLDEQRDAALALHEKRPFTDLFTHEPTGAFYCAACAPGNLWPCETAKALGAVS